MPRMPLLGVVAALALAVAAPEPSPSHEPSPYSDPPPASSVENSAMNPCANPSLALRCPNLIMAPPRDLYVTHGHGGVQLHATNAIINIGQGPMEIRAKRTGLENLAPAYQVIRRRAGGVRFFPNAGYVYWKAIPGQGHYWKYWRAARFELWSLGPDGTRDKLVRIGPKLSYCLRDLRRVRFYARSPRARQFPGCSQDAGRRHLRLGTSVGWADIYPATYNENYIAITGLHGCFDFVHRADPEHELIEEREDDNVGHRRIRLPPRGGRILTC